MTKMASYSCIEFDLNSDPDPVIFICIFLFLSHGGL